MDDRAAKRQIKAYKKRRRRKITYAVLGVLFFVLFFYGGARLFLGSGLYKSLLSVMDGDTVRVTVGGDSAEDIQQSTFMDGENIYFTVDFVKEYIDETIFWDKGSNKLTVTDAESVIRMSTDDLTYYVNNEPLTLEFPLYGIENTVYIPEGILEEVYNLSVTYNEDSHMIVIDFQNQELKKGTITRSTKITEEADSKSKTVTRLKKGEDVFVFSSFGKYTKVRTAEGRAGYMPTENIADIQTVKQPEAVPKVKEPWKAESGKINMLWDQVFKVEQSASLDRRVVIDGLDVLSPTWFKLQDSEGNISNIADKGYVDWAHQNGYQVWALFSNDFDAAITHDTLSDTDKREKIIRQILAFAALYDLDGINIDFESVAKADGEYYVQFIREITPFLRQQGIVVSVDMYIPTSWTSHYGMEEVGRIVDYVCIMAYDEHWATSEVSGSVASLGWTRDAMEKAVSMVDRDKLIMGMPFYTRLWAEEEVNGQIEVTSKALGMENAYNNLVENNAEIVYDEETGQNYGEYVKNGITYKIWLEDEKSMEERLTIAKDLDLAGTAAWKRGFEKDSIWSLIKKYLKEA